MKRIFTILFLLSCLTLLSCTRQASTEKVDSHRSSSAIHCVDVSHHNGKIDWEILAERDNMQFVFIKATEGSTIVDSEYHGNLSGAREAGLKVGAYHFLTTSSSADKQFKNFKCVVMKADIDLIPVLDAEGFTKKHPMTKDEYMKHVRVWVDLCKEHYGKAPILYCSVGHYQGFFKGRFDDCMFWAGDVNASRSYVSAESWVIWQKTIRKCHGCSSRLDINILAPGKTLKDISLRPNGID